MSEAQVWKRNILEKNFVNFLICVLYFRLFYLCIAKIDIFVDAGIRTADLSQRERPLWRNHVPVRGQSYEQATSMYLQNCEYKSF